jgi:hypothetical protein
MGMSINWEDYETDRRERQINEIQPIRWNWVAILSFISAGLCSLALWRGSVWLGLKIYEATR